MACGAISELFPRPWRRSPWSRVARRKRQPSLSTFLKNNAGSQPVWQEIFDFFGRWGEGTVAAPKPHGRACRTAVRHRKCLLRRTALIYSDPEFGDLSGHERIKVVRHRNSVFIGERGAHPDRRSSHRLSPPVRPAPDRQRNPRPPRTRSTRARQSHAPKRRRSTPNPPPPPPLHSRQLELSFPAT